MVPSFGRAVMWLLLIPSVGFAVARTLGDRPGHEASMLVPRYVTEACALGGAGLMAFILLMALGARGSRARLAVLFGVGRRVVVLVLGVLVIAQGLIVLFVIAAVSGEVFHALPGMLMLLLLLVTAALGLQIIGSGLMLSRPSPRAEIGVAVTREEQPRLWALMMETAARTGAQPPDNLVLAQGLAFYAAGIQVRVANRPEPLQGQTIALSLPMLRALTEAELVAIIGHELGHFRGKDIAYNLRFAPVYQHMSRLLGAAHSVGGVATIVTLPARAVLGFFTEQFGVAERAIARDREIEADRVAVMAAGAPALASALLKCALLAGAWQTQERQGSELARSGRAFRNDAEAFAMRATGCFAGLPGSAAVEQALAYRVPHPTDTHPPIGARLAALGIGTEGLAGCIRMPEGPSARDLVVNAEGVERTLTAVSAQMRIATMRREAASRAAAAAG